MIQLGGWSAGTRMTIRYPALAIASLVLALLAGAPRAEAATVVGSPDPTVVAPLDRESVVEEPGVVTEARVHAKRLRGTEQPRIVVLRPAEVNGRSSTVGAFAPVPVVSRGTSVHEANSLHLPVEPGDSIGLLLPAGQVELGMRTQPQPDGTVDLFTEPCDPCGMDGRTARELLFNATVEPDDDQDGLGDASQDPDFGLGGTFLDDDEGDDWFDELDEDEEDEPSPRQQAGAVQLLGVDKARNGDPIVKLRTPGRGVVNGFVTTSGGRWDRGIPTTIGIAEQVRSRRAGRVRLRIDLSPAGRRMLERPGPQRAVVVISVQTSDIRVAMRRFRQ
jgi:hypothetical protein